MTSDITPIPYVILSQVEAKPINWLWNPYIPKGAATMIVGDGGYGKSYMTCAIAADLSAGRALPGQEALPPQKILMISAEDAILPVIKPRLEAMGADMDKIAVYDEGFTVNPNMTARILAAVKEFDAAIVFFDPMVVYLGGDIDIFKPNEVRSILTQLTSIAKKEDIAIVGVHHVKKAGGVGQARSLGSVDLVNGVRSMVLVDITKSGTYFMSHVKSNWAKKGPQIAYDFNEERFNWLGEIEPMVDEVHEISHTPRNKAKSFILAILKDGPVPSIEMIKRARDEGLSERTINRAKRGLAHSMERDHKWYWELDEGMMPHPETIGETASDALLAVAKTLPRLEIAKPETDMERLIREAKEKMDAASSS